MSTADSLTFAGTGTGDPGAAPGRRGLGRAHGKAILLGEHAVVYGGPGLAIPVPQLTATATARPLSCPDDGPHTISFAMTGPGIASPTPVAADSLQYLLTAFEEITPAVRRICVEVVIDCAIPPGRGLGSSAACARAAVLAIADVLDHPLDATAVFDLVQVSEKVVHGKASGIDALTTGATAPLFFHAGTAQELPIAMPGDSGSRHRPDGFDGLFVVGDSGVNGSTKDAVEQLRRTFDRNAGTQQAFVRQVSDLTHAALRDLTTGQVSDFGARLIENHRVLREVGLSTDRIDALVEAALVAGGLGAKISGGGLGGCMIALAADPAAAEKVVAGLQEAGAVRTWTVPVGRFAGHAH